MVPVGIGLLTHAGDCDSVLEDAVACLDAYRRFQVENLNRIRGAPNIKTGIPMQRIKLTTELLLKIVHSKSRCSLRVGRPLPYPR